MGQSTLRGSYGTIEELRFIEGLGFNWRDPATTEFTREGLLRGYLEGAKHRKNWGSINKGVVIDRVKKELGI